MIICIVGPSCAGKTTASKHIKSTSNVTYLEASEYVRRRYKRSDKGGELLDFVINTFENEGRDTFAKDLISDNPAKLMEEPYLFTGFRATEEVQLVRENYDEVRCVGVFANSTIRFERNVRREREGIHEYQEFIRKDFIEYDFGIASLLADFCDDILINEGTLDEFYDTINDEVVDPYL